MSRRKNEVNLVEGGLIRWKLLGPGRETVLPQHVGDHVNVEFDLIGKYLLRQAEVNSSK